MISVKGGTQTWSNAQQKTDFKSDGSKSISASDKQKFFGDEENVGEVLNKIADPNWVDPSKKMRTAGNPELDKDAFMSLLLTQMKNQDPTNPMKSHEMAAQLAQFTSLEKLTNINDSIENLNKAQKPGQNFAALSLIGKAVSGDSSQIIRNDETEFHDIRFKIPTEAQNATVTIKDENGEEIRKLKMSSLKQGSNEVSWNGLKEDGSKAKPGKYVASFEARSSNGAKLFVETKFEGIISGVNFTPNGPVMMVGKQTIPMSEIKEIIDPKVSAEQGLNKVKTSEEIQSQKAGAKVIPESGKKQVEGTGNIQDVAFSRGMMNQLKNAGIKAGI